MTFRRAVALPLFVTLSLPHLLLAASSGNPLQDIMSSAVQHLQAAASEAASRGVSCADITHNLRIGSRDRTTSGDVSVLQSYLIAQGYLSGSPSGYYGSLTARAVGKMQLAIDILSSSKNSGFGSVGPKTRAAIACGNTSDNTNAPSATTNIVSGPSNRTTITPITTPLDQLGEADPFLINGDASSEVYQAVTSLTPSKWSAAPFVASIVLKYSADNGKSWQSIARLADGGDLSISGEVRMEETATLARDSSDTPSLQYKFLWNDYRMQSGEPDLSTNWIAIKEGGAMAGPYGPETKLFAGSRYDPNNTLSPGYPAIYPLPTAVGDCPWVAEPSALSGSNGFYLAFNCNNQAAGYVTTSLVKIMHQGGKYTMQSLGTLLSQDDVAKIARAYGSSYPQLSDIGILVEPNLFVANGATYLLVTPHASDFARGCILLQVADLDTAALVRNADGSPKIIRYVPGDTPSSNRGACTYAPNDTTDGITLSQVVPSQAPVHPAVVKTTVHVP